METIAIWKLSTFCGFYGRIIPNFPTNKANEKFNSFHTYTSNPDIDDLKVTFEPKLEPMYFMDLVSESTKLFVMGHGSFYRDCYGRGFYESYTLYDMNGLIEYLKKNIAEEELNKVLKDLNLMSQTMVKLDNKQ